MKQIIFFLTLSLGLSAFGAKVVKTPAIAKGYALGQIADKNLAGKEATTLIKNILEGQEYQGRVSIMNTECVQKEVFDGPKPKNPPTTCSVTIGVDDLNDDDSGWGVVYRLDYVIDAKGNVLGAALDMIAG